MRPELVPLRALATVRSGYSFKSRDWQETRGVPVVKIANVKAGRLALDDCSFVSEERAAEAAHYRLRKGDILIGMTGYVGEVARVNTDEHLVLNQRVGRFTINDPVRVLSDYLYYVLLSPDAQDRLRQLGYGSAQPNISPDLIGSLSIPLPSLGAQRNVVSLLSALDDKIDSNRRLARLLEGVAATVFRARFVDFVGVEEFDNSDIGRVPRGWRTGALTDLASFVNGKAFTKDANGRGRPILRIRELNSGVDDNTLRADLDAADEYVARDRDILFAWSGSLGVRRWSGPESLINQHIFKVVPGSYPPWFVYQWICRHMVEFQAIASEKATTMGHIQRRHLSEAAVPIPDVAAIGEARDALDPIDEYQGILDAETRTLAVIRDALLPKLISGQIQVPDTNDPQEVIGPAAERLAAATP